MPESTLQAITIIFWKKTNTLLKLMNMENTVYIFADANSRLKVVNKENGEETFFNNLEEVDLFLSQT